ncbi:MAG TPA: tRNA (N6-isopentenyl adenosine(37)-C2)-methylthiotransferase MiaB [Gemmataceae bacterium]|nr:tRNA (N6-isopentenyl adenosine(37)-C2)-methylthiotransferase MiaB [Gemmataceae bacterium]
MTKKLYLETVGCQMNVLDSELVVGSLRRQGYTLTQEATDADVILFNTCSVRQHAEDKIYSALGRLRHHKKRHPDTIVGVLGCMAQKDQELIRKRAPQVDIICGTGQLAQLPALIEEAKKTGKLQLALSLDRTESRHDVERSFESYDPLRDPSMRPSRFQAYVRIMIGCDKFCTYCIVPSVRGPEQSRPPEHIAAEVRQLAAEGCKEITLLGQTVNSYKFDYGDGRRVRLSELLTQIHDTAGLERIKFVTNFPKDMGDDLLDAVRELPKACPYLHVPAQSGCNEVLKRMKRLYTVEYYREMLLRCREKVPGVAVSSDFIVGFSGETEESFEKTCDLVRESGFKNSFIFKYSPRPGTKGHEMFADDVPEEIKKRRNNDLLAIQNAVSLADHRRHIGNTVEVLVEGPSKNANKRETASGPMQLTGRTPTDHIVVFDGNERLTGRTVEVIVDDATSFTLFGAVETDEFVGATGVANDEELTPIPVASRWSLPIV